MQNVCPASIFFENAEKVGMFGLFLVDSTKNLP